VTSPARVVVLASGSGSVFAALADAAAITSDDTAGAVRITRLVCDQPDAGVMARAREAGVEAVAVPLVDRSARAQWDVAVADAIAAGRPDLVVSAGFMRILGPAVLDRFAERVINTHPALLPAFPGAHAVRDALAYGVRVTGCTVHLVDAGVDTGPVLAQRAVEVLPGDDEESLHERIKTEERHLLPEVVFGMLRNGWTIDGRRVTFP
jgi:formyltetrahydrofolate-dependent phosphoribosylglycinamide formyltransferase